MEMKHKAFIPKGRLSGVKRLKERKKFEHKIRMLASEKQISCSKRTDKICGATDIFISTCRKAEEPNDVTKQKTKKVKRNSTKVLPKRVRNKKSAKFKQQLNNFEENTNTDSYTKNICDGHVSNELHADLSDHNIEESDPGIAQSFLGNDLCDPPPILIEMDKSDSSLCPLKCPNFKNVEALSSSYAFEFKNIANTLKYSDDNYEHQYYVAEYGKVDCVSVNPFPEKESNLCNREDETSFVDKRREVCLESANESEDSGSTPIILSFKLLALNDNNVLLALQYPSTLFFKGVMNIHVLLGTIVVMGYEITENSSEEYTVFSPQTCSFLGLQSCSAQVNRQTLEEIQHPVLNLYSEQLEDIFYTFPSLSSLILLKRVSSSLIPFLNKYFPQALFPSGISNCSPFCQVERNLNCEFILPEMYNSTKLHNQKEEWINLVANLFDSKGSLRVMVCGGKSVGKSTVLRFLVNRSLSKFKEVLYIDFDPGQCEFTVPGCVSATVVRKPLLGPNFTHLTSPDRTVYIGEINVAQCPAQYLNSVQHILNYCSSRSEYAGMPWFVNTMGFSKGLGVDLTVSVIKMTSPNHVVQIQSINSKRNFPHLLTSSYIEGYTSIICGYSNVMPKSHYTFHELPSAAEDATSARTPWGMEAHKCRDVVILSYFCNTVSLSNLSLLSVTPHRIPFNRMKLCICHEKIQFSHYLAAMNGNLVALCKTDDLNILVPSDMTYPHILRNSPVSHCYGFGIVRGVDIAEKHIYLITPLTSEEVELVNCLVLGAVHLPNTIYRKQEEAIGFVPYIVKGSQSLLDIPVKSLRSSVQFR